ncbi:MAG: nuclear transport factor 2 family protein [bacterium]
MEKGQPSTTGNERKEVVLKLFDAYLKEDLKRIKNLLTDDIRLVVNSYKPSLVREGIYEVLELVQGIFNRAHITEINPHEIMSEENKVMVYLTEKGVWAKGAPSAGDSYQGDRLHIYKIKNGKIMSAEYYLVNENPIPLPGSVNPGH